MREMIGVVKYTCDFCGGTVTKPSSIISRLPQNWDSIKVLQTVAPFVDGFVIKDRCPQCREQNANK